VARSYGLDFFETIFEMLAADELNEVAAYGGFPTRYPHWRHGMGFEQLDKGYRYGLQKIYELVINNDPCYAYLLSSNSAVENKLVIAHVYGHCDFFKNNMWFARTHRKMMDRMANHATRVRHLVDRHGQGRVEDFIDKAQSLENMVDLFGEFVESKEPWPRSVLDEDEQPEPARLKVRSKTYMDSFMNPPHVIESRRRRIEEAQEKEKRLPGGPQRDLLGFLLRHAPLERWEAELLQIIREEALYFAPQRATKIMNEGWATYWHRKIMVEHILDGSEVVDYADTMAGTLAEGSSLNPYKLGLELFLDIEERWNRGQFGLEYERCDDMHARENWDTHLMAGRDQIYLCRRVHNDVTFVDEYLTEEFCHRHKLFVYRWNPRTRRREIVTREFKTVKDQLLRQLANGGAPVIEAVDINYHNRGELYLLHRHDLQDLRPDWATATLNHIQSMWRRPVHLETCVEDKRIRYTCDGRDTTTHALGDTEPTENVRVKRP
jgi:stage V sporulation protein R